MEPIRQYKVYAGILAGLAVVPLCACIYVSAASVLPVSGIFATLVMAAASIPITRPTRRWNEHLVTRLAGWIVFAAAFLFVLRLACLEVWNTEGEYLAHEIVSILLLCLVVFSCYTVPCAGLLFHDWRRCRKEGPGALMRNLGKAARSRMAIETCDADQ